jgi:hypothetical protein
MTSLERRIEALEGRTGPAIRLGVCVFLGESDDTAIRGTAAENGFAFEQIAAAVLFYEPEFPSPPTLTWDVTADACRRHEQAYAKWAAEFRPIKHLCLRPHHGVELRNWVSIVDALRVINQAPSERYAAFERAMPMSRDQERQRSEVDAALRSLADKKAGGEDSTSGDLIRDAQ